MELFNYSLMIISQPIFKLLSIVYISIAKKRVTKCLLLNTRQIFNSRGAQCYIH